jgi:hypothetical protein
MLNKVIKIWVYWHSPGILAFKSVKLLSSDFGAMKQKSLHNCEVANMESVIIVILRLASIPKVLENLKWRNCSLGIG